MSKHRPPGSIFAALAATVAALGAAPVAVAAPGLYQTVEAWGLYHHDLGSVINDNRGQNFPTGNASSYWFVTCVGSVPGEPCASDGQPEPDAWYKMPVLPTSAAAQAWTPDYGVNRVRTWSSGTNGVNTGAPGYTAYYARAESGWREEITTTSAAPVTITFVVALHVDWNDGSLWAFQMGLPGIHQDPDGPSGALPMAGSTWSNCTVEHDELPCGTEYSPAFEYITEVWTVLPGGDNGSADLIVTQDFTVYPGGANPFVALLSARSFANGSEVLGYSTASLQAILVPPGANLTFASGHSYNVQVVPEPATYALWLLGLVGVAAVTRRRARPGSGEDFSRGHGRQ